jgi:hypothetical protein
VHQTVETSLQLIATPCPCRCYSGQSKPCGRYELPISHAVMIRKMQIGNRVRVPVFPANHGVADVVQGAVEAKVRCVRECQDESGSQYYRTVTCEAGEEAALPGVKLRGVPGRRFARGEREFELSSTAAGEEVPVGDEGYQRH